MSYDVIVVGGGLAGSTLAAELSRAGRRVLILERETRFKDRVRGENMLPWGVAAARRLGLVEDLLAAGAHQPGSWITYMAGTLLSSRDLHQTTSHGEVSLNIYHPAMQEALLARALALGAEAKRGATVVQVAAAPGQNPTVTFEHQGKQETIKANVVVGADGRTSQLRTWGGFAADCLGPGSATLLAPLGQKRARVYFVYPGLAGRRGLSGIDKIPEFVESCQSTGIPASWIADAQCIGPLAEFDGADRWVPSPAKNRVALIGDAAASSDPSWACGLSLTLLDVEHLANALRATDDWDAALKLYARQHDEYYSALHRILGWMTELLWTPGPDADERRGRVLPRMLSDPRGFPDSIGHGPFGPSDEHARRLTLGLD